MSAASTDPIFGEVLRWLAAHAGFPARRLDAKAEAVVCVAALAAAEAAADQQRFLIQRRDPAQTSAQRQHAQRRSQVHYKCDNSAKV